MQTGPSDLDWLEAAARLGARGRPGTRPNPAVGCIIVKDGQVVGRGWTQAGGRPHGEAMALAEAGPETRGSTVYTALEPCAHPSERGPTCTQLLVAAAPARVVIGLTDPDPRTNGRGAERLIASGITVDHIASPVVSRSLDGFLVRQKLGRPHVTLKLALSLDGCIAMANGESQWITGEEARAHVHSRRAMADAILVGGGTWRNDLPRLNVRLPGLEERSPKRVVLSRGVPIDGVKIINEPAQINTLDDAQYLYIEGGAETAASFLAADLVDRIDMYRAPVIIGSGMPALGDIGLTRLGDAHGRWQMAERRQLGTDCYEAYERIRS